MSALADGTGEAGEAPIALGTLVDGLGEQAYGSLLVLLATPNLVPVPLVPGSTTLTGIAIALVGAELLAGRPRPWLPERLRALRLTRDAAARWLERAGKLGERAPSRSAEPPPTSPVPSRAIGVLAVVHGAVLALPVPFGNFLPGLAVVLLGLGLARRDHRLLAIGYAVSALAFAIVAVVVCGAARLARLILPPGGR